MISSPRALFVELSYRLKSFRDATVLVALLLEKADERELKISLMNLALGRLANQLTFEQVRKSIRDLKAAGLVTTRVHPHLKTFFSVDRAAVLQLLASPLPETLPAMSDHAFPFLAVWQAATERATLITEPVASPSESEPGPQTHPHTPPAQTNH
jgi:hypothetical protein